MREIKPKKQTFISKGKTERGFTLIELLISLSILLIILLITPTIWTNLKHQPQTERFAVQQFFHTLTDEVQTNQVSHHSSEQLLLENINNDQIRLSKYNDTIRRQVNRTGHEILLYNVDTFEIHHADQFVLIKLKMKSGNRYEKVITKFFLQ